MNLMHSLAKLLITPLVALLSFGGYNVAPAQVPVSAPMTLGASNPTGGGTYRLQSSIGTANTSIPLSSFKEPISGTPYTMTYLNSAVEYGTLDPQQPSRSEFISFTGITQNADGTALLTGVTRGLSRSYPYTNASSSVFSQSHAGQSIFILSDAPGLFNEYAVKRNDQTITGNWTFSLSPFGPTPTSSTQIATKGYVDGVALSGAPNADTSTKGIVQMATGAQASAGTSLGSTGASLVIGANLATSTCQTAASSALIASSTTGKLNSTCFDTASPYTLTGAHTFSTATTTFNATTSISATVGSSLFLNTVKYNLPSTQGLASTTLTNDAAGNLTWSLPTKLASTTITASGTISGVDFTEASTTVPANTLGKSNAIRIRAGVCMTDNSTSATLNVILQYGTSSTSAQILVASGSSRSFCGPIEAVLMANNSTGSQVVSLVGSLNSSNPSANDVGGGMATFGSTLSEDSTVDKVIKLRLSIAATGTGSASGATVEFLRL